MNTRFKELTDKIKSSYERGVGLDEAEKLAAEFLYAQISVGEELRKADLDARMKKSGLKTIKAAVYLAEIQANEKKPSDVLLAAKVDVHSEVNLQQDSFDTAEVEKEELERFYSVFREAHIFYRGVSKGRFE